MAGYIGSKIAVTQVDGYNRTEADAEFLNQSEGDTRYVNVTGDTMTGVLNGRSFITADDNNNYALMAGRYSSGYGGAAINTTANASFLELQVNGFGGLRADSAGRVTMPYQPSFIAFPSSNYSLSTGVTEIPCDATSTNIGGHFNTSTNRFTAPVAGQYLFIVSIALNTSSSSYTYLSAELLVNNAFRFHAGWGNKDGNGYGRETYSVILTLGASDYVVPRTEFSTANFTALGSSNGRYSSFSGHLLG